MKSVLSTIAFFAVLMQHANGQGHIPLGEWRIHVSYHDIISVAEGGGHVFAAAPNGIVVVDKNDKSFRTIDKINALTRTGIVTIEYNTPSDQLIVAFDDGTFDVVAKDGVRNFDPSRNTVLTGSDAINDIVVRENDAYICTDYGVLIFDLSRSEIKETWRDLGPTGETLPIHGITFFGDSVFLASASGVLRANVADNLLDFNKWIRSTGGELNTSIQFITQLAGKVVAAIDGVGLFLYENGVWDKYPAVQSVSFSALSTTPEKIYFGSANSVYVIDDQLMSQQFTRDEFTRINSVAVDAEGRLWIGDRENGLLSTLSDAVDAVVPNGPSMNNAFQLQWNNGKMYLAGGGPAPDKTALQNPGELNYFENGLWTSSKENINDITSIEFTSDGKTVLASYGFGVVVKDNATAVLYDETNSSLLNTDPPGRNVRVTDLSFSSDGVWVANYGSSQPLHLFTQDGDWQSYSFPYPGAKYPLNVLTDFEHNVWLRLDPAQGGGLVVFNKESNEHRFLTENDGSGELPANSVYSIALDRDGYVWAGTDAGVAYFYDEGSDAVKPIFENRFLLRDDKVTAIAVDGGNRKWMGTERGVWLFDATGEQSLANFTSANSPLLSDRIIDIEVDPVSGEVFFATDKGLISYRSDATESSGQFDAIKIFPNPVTNNFQGEVGISGLGTDAVVKITDVSGKLIFQTVANGGTASWNVRDYRGNRVRSGVFLVFAVMQDGSESVVGKIAVVN
jgi:ligand-binding sensor domain-containing protein